MKKSVCFLSVVMFLMVALLVPVQSSHAAKPIILGVPTSLGFLEGKEGLACVQMAVDEINKAGGVKVGDEMRPFQGDRHRCTGCGTGGSGGGCDSRPQEADSGGQGGFYRLRILSFRVRHRLHGRGGAYKIPMILGTAMSPGMQKKVMTDYDKYKYTFRACLNAVYLIKYLGGTMAYLNKEFGFNKVYIMNQDVAWARKTGDLMIKLVFDKMGWEVVGRQQYPTGSVGFFSGPHESQSQRRPGDSAHL
jgi:branched-chain amino acid transport system substrate-binding protein